MNRIRKFALAVLVTFAVAAVAQQATTMPSVNEHLKWLSGQLNLTADQQTDLRPILQNMQDGMVKIQQDQSLSDDTRHQKLEALHSKAVQDAKQFLTTEQQQKLDELSKQRHVESHTETR